MGSKLVSAAFAFVNAYNERARTEGQRKLESLEALLLAFMSHTALDDDPEPVFWMKRSEMCGPLGIQDTEAGRKRLQRAISALAAAGAIAVPEKHRRGYVPRYRLIHQGGYQASTLYPQVWTPDAPLEPVRGMPGVQGYGRLASRSMDAQHPLEEGRGTKEEGRAREPIDTAADLDTLQTPPTPSEPDLKPHCDEHPPGWSRPCYACGQARKAYEATHGKPSARRKPPKYDCSAGRHKVIGEKSPGVPDDICVNCGTRTHPIGETA